MIARATRRASDRRCFLGTVDERINESGADSAIRHGAEAPLHGRAPVPDTAEVPTAAAARRALGHVGLPARRARHHSRGATGRTKTAVRARARPGCSTEHGQANTRPVSDTYWMTVPYNTRSWRLDVVDVSTDTSTYADPLASRSPQSNPPLSRSPLRLLCVARFHSSSRCT